VTRHHGEIKVLSQPGSTRFQIRLPIQQEQQPMNNAQTEA
jgi:nitrogen-specific signal transduction histidine kinase